MNRWAIFGRPLRGLLMQNRQSQLLRCWKIKIPPPLPLLKTHQAGDGIFVERENSHCGLNTLCAKCPKLLSAFGQVSWLCFALAGEHIHSGATSRDSHPLPYSPRFDASHPNACQNSEIKNLSGCPTISLGFVRFQTNARRSVNRKFDIAISIADASR